MFYGTVDNGETFVEVSIHKESAQEAWQALEQFAEKLEECDDDFYGKVECLILLDENHDIIVQTGEPVEYILDAYSHSSSTMFK